MNKSYGKKITIYQFPHFVDCAVRQNETVDHPCPYNAQSQYKRRHDFVALYIHWMIAKNSGLSVTEK